MAHQSYFRGSFNLVLMVCLISELFFLSKVKAERLGVTTPRVNAMGQAGIGGGLANTALVLNPAGMSAGAFYAIDANYFRSSNKSNLIGINIVDSKLRYTRDKVALGIGYQTELKSGESSGHDVLVGISKALSKIGDSLLLAGLSGRYIYDESSQKDGFNLNAGLMLQLSSFFSVGLVGHDLLEENDRRLGTGIGFTSRQISVNLDYLRQLESKQNQYRFGAEAMVSEGFAIRGGYLHNQNAAQTNSLTDGSVDLNDSNLISQYRFTPNQWSAGVAFIGFGGGEGQLSLSYTQALDHPDYFFGLSLNTNLSM